MAVAPIFKKKDKTEAPPPWEACFKFEPDGKSYVCLHASHVSPPSYKTHSLFATRNPMNHWFDTHLMDCPRVPRDEKIAEWKTKARKFDKEPSGDADEAIEPVTRRVTEAGLRQEITRITALFKLAELWVDGPVKELITYIAPNIHVFSRSVLGRYRYVLKEAARIMTETRSITASRTRLTWRARRSRLRPSSSTATGWTRHSSSRWARASS